jgi:hypothetical protein
VALITLNKPTQASIPREQRRPADVVLGVPGGASPRGSTYWKRLRTCPREGALYAIGLRKTGSGSEALDAGLLFHQALEVYYRSLANGGKAFEAEAEAWAGLEPIKGEPGYEETYAEVERLVAAYFEHYRNQDRWTVIAVEETLEYHGAFEYSARLDLIVEDHERKGMWVVEHKTARSINQSLLTGYQMDMQILGQVWLLQQCVDLSQYPKLQGVLINIVTKHAAPRFERVEVLPSKYHLAAFTESMAAQHQLARVYAQLGHPKYLGNCTGGVRYFSTCDFFDLCHGRPEASADFWGDTEPPFGFINAHQETD